MITADALRCRCRRADCDAPVPDPAFLDQLRALEARYGEALVVTSGVRCRVQNERVGGAPNSGHLRATEADLACTSGAARWRLVHAAISVGIQRLGMGKTFLHVGGLSALPQQVIWHYYALVLALVGALWLVAPAEAGAQAWRPAAAGMTAGPGGAAAESPSPLPSPSRGEGVDRLVGWELLRNGLCALELDDDGDGRADRTELHVVARWGRTMLTDRELDAQAAQDGLWLVILDGDDGRFLYWLVPEALGSDWAPACRPGAPCGRGPEEGR